MFQLVDLRVQKGQGFAPQNKRIAYILSSEEKLIIPISRVRKSHVNNAQSNK